MAARCCEEAGASLVVAAEDEVEGEMLMEVRRLCFTALERRGGTLLEDVGVPRGRVAELLARIEAIAARTGLEIATFGHVGDGNMHPTIVFDRASADERERAHDAAGAIFEAALALGGTITGEHGVGTLKLPWLEDEIGARARELGPGREGGLRPGRHPQPGQGPLGAGAPPGQAVDERLEAELEQVVGAAVPGRAVQLVEQAVQQRVGAAGRALGVPAGGLAHQREADGVAAHRAHGVRRVPARSRCSCRKASSPSTPAAAATHERAGLRPSRGNASGCASARVRNPRPKPPTTSRQSPSVGTSCRSSSSSSSTTPSSSAPLSDTCRYRAIASTPELGAEHAHRERVEPALVDEAQRGLDDPAPRQRRAAPGALPRRALATHRPPPA